MRITALHYNSLCKMDGAPQGGRLISQISGAISSDQFVPDSEDKSRGHFGPGLFFRYLFFLKHFKISWLFPESKKIFSLSLIWI